MGSQSPVADLPRDGESFVLHTRNDRFFRSGEKWFFHTREDVDIGPFDNKNQAQLALVYFIEHDCWPSARQMRAYVQNPPQVAAPGSASWLKM
jgi:hypothetical protein